MRDQLIDYVNLLFAGAPEAADMKDEILQNTLDRYDDLIAQGKAPQAAYRLAIAGIGDIGQILGEDSTPNKQTPTPPPPQPETVHEKKKLQRAIAIAMYIVCPVPLFLLEDTLGLCIMLGIIACATAIMILTGTKQITSSGSQEKANSPRRELRRGIRGIIWVLGLCLYFLVSFSTNYWHITWLIFPLTGAVQGLVIACVDLLEAK